MVAMTLDTHASVKELTAAGFSEPQSKALMKMVHQAFAALTSAGLCL